jgi:hypothetical protein
VEKPIPRGSRKSYSHGQVLSSLRAKDARTRPNQHKEVPRRQSSTKAKEPIFHRQKSHFPQAHANTSGAGRARWCDADAVNPRARSRTHAGRPIELHPIPPGRRRRRRRPRRRLQKHEPGIARPQNIPRPFPSLPPSPSSSTGRDPQQQYKTRKQIILLLHLRLINRTTRCGGGEEQPTTRRGDPTNHWSSDPPHHRPESFAFYVNQPSPS